MQIRVTRSGRKHGIGTAHIRAAMTDAGEPLPEGDSLKYIGVDDRGVELEIVAVPDNRRRDGLAIIHAMPTWFRKGGAS